ncbi:hypothetical protein VB711_01785 [Cronbergia sp. UHCC 0137]|uniref:hypothetical protein n=1 Tax=Cronbergia sp. UHCC 0137 TaxID=3110239 RepID=UPI002B1F4B60|nr:hypothetical protein [Cronbergia sp. UHCC 0137]MEA5616573.1 hypothetical protein [Cronbergia sp. UHCC 0137]
MNSKYLDIIAYETRNLGITSFALNEVFFESPEQNLLKQDIFAAIQAYNQIFIQCRLSKQNINLSSIVQNCGFYVVESTLSPYTNLNKNKIIKSFIQNKDNFIPARYKIDKFNITQININDACNSREQIQKIAEESFIDDRFHVDPNCTQDIANKRFSYWVGDLCSDRNVIFECLEYENEKIAFMCRKESNLILAGFNKRYRNSGLGEFLWLSILENMIQEGIQYARTLISTNNTSVLNLYARIGFQFKNPLFTFHYWHKSE